MIIWVGVERECVVDEIWLNNCCGDVVSDKYMGKTLLGLPVKRL